MSENNNAVSDLSSFWGVYGKCRHEGVITISEYEDYTSRWSEYFVEQDLGEVAVSGTWSQKNELLRELAEKAAALGANLVLEAELTSADPSGISDFFSSCLQEDDEPLYISGRAVKTVSDEILYRDKGFFNRPGEFYGAELLVTRQDPIKVGSTEVSLGGAL